MMLMGGFFSVMEGLVAIFKDDYYLVAKSGLAVNIDYTAWGWTHLIAGCIIVAAGFGLFTGKTWARVVGVVLAVVSALVNFAFIAAFPVWGVVVIAIDVFVIFALTVHGRQMQD
jgi:hypothetical protein